MWLIPKDAEKPADGRIKRVPIRHCVPDSVILSSPYKRAVDTVKYFADTIHLPVIQVDGFRERKVDSIWVEDFDGFCQHQWNDFSYKLSDGESLSEVQDRNIRALEDVLSKYKEKNIVIGSHGTALGTIINYYDKTFDYEEFRSIKSLMPWIVKFTFSGKKIRSIEMINLFL